jgi:cytochrome c biogenesis factor
MKLKRIGVGSAARMAAVLYAVMGLIVGGFLAVCSVMGAAFTKMASSESSGAGIFGLFFGVGAVLIMPPLYAICGGVMAAITAWLYNGVAKMAGGIEVDLE